MARPHASRYPLELAVGDVVQRCLDAGAAQVDLAIEFAGAHSWIRVAAGAAGVVAATPDPPGTVPSTPAGLDLVGACLTLGSTVSVASTDASGERTITRWEGDGEQALELPAAEAPALLAESGADGDPGATVVLVEGLHEVLAYKRQEGRVIEAVLTRMGSRANAALGLAFHRALGGAARRRAPVAITVNAEPVAARDPFGLAGPALRLRRRELPFVVGSRVEAVVATPHVLPASAADPAGGRQGFFVYLRDRLVQVGGWSRLSVADRTDGVARIAVDLPPAAVGSFTWEAAARRVLFPISLAPALRALAFEAVSGTIGPDLRTGLRIS
jgi:hypothetical protein